MFQILGHLPLSEMELNIRVNAKIDTVIRPWNIGQSQNLIPQVFQSLLERKCMPGFMIVGHSAFDVNHSRPLQIWSNMVSFFH